MSDLTDEFRARCEDFVERYGVALEETIGAGQHGNVFRTDRQSAVKFFEREEHYRRERDVYLRLRDHGVRKIRNLNVPVLLNHYDDHLAIEMTVVDEPYLLDFAGAYLDEPPDYPPEVIEQWREEKQEQFEHRWPDVEAILFALRSRYGIHLMDVNPRNIAFED